MLLVGEQPEDAYYVRRALGAAALSDPVVKIRSGLFADLDASTLAGSRCARTLQPCAASARRRGTALDEFVATGGGVVLFPAPHSDLGYYNRDLLPGLTPGRFKNRVGTPGNTANYQVLDADEPHHPLFNDLLCQRRRSTALLRLLRPSPRARPSAFGPFQRRATRYGDSLEGAGARCTRGLPH